MKLLFKLISAFCLLFLLKESKADTVMDNDLPAVILQGRIIDQALLDSPGFVSDIYIRTSKYAFGGIEQRRTDHNEIELSYKSGEVFKAVLPAPAGIFYLRIYYKTPGIPNKAISWIDRIFIVKAGDSLNCQLDTENIIFSGRGAERMNCQVEIFNNAYTASVSDMELFKEKKYKDYLNTIERKSDSCLTHQLNIIDRYRSNLDRNFTEILTANCYGLRYYSQVRQFNIFFENRILYDDFIEVLEGQYDFDRLKRPPFYIAEENLAKSPLYTNWLIQLRQLNLYMVSYKNIKRNSEDYIRKLFHDLDTGYSGIIKDKMLTLFFLSYIENKYAANLMDKAIDQIESDHYLKILLNRKSRFSQGSSFYKFTLENVGGEKVKLADFRDKVVFIHFWYRGCGGCIQLANAMSPILEKFKDNPNVKFVTVSTDKDRNTWLQGLKDGKYTHASEINLYAGRQNPLIEYYNISTFPTFYLVKSDRMFSATPPRPELDRETGEPQMGGETAELVALIELALAQL